MGLRQAPVEAKQILSSYQKDFLKHLEMSGASVGRILVCR